MNLNRLNLIVMSGVVAFNFGMTWEDFQAEWEKRADNPHMQRLLAGPVEPRLFSDEEKLAINEHAERETRLVDALMGLDDADFSAWIKRQRDARDEALTHYSRPGVMHE